MSATSEAIARLRELREKAALNALSCSPQKGTPGRCHLAQVWDADGNSLIQVEPTVDPDVASATAALVVALPALLECAEALQAYLTAEDCDDSQAYADLLNEANDKARAALDALASQEKTK